MRFIYFVIFIIKYELTTCLVQSFKKNRVFHVKLVLTTKIPIVMHSFNDIIFFLKNKEQKIYWLKTKLKFHIMSNNISYFPFIFCLTQKKIIIMHIIASLIAINKIILNENLHNFWKSKSIIHSFERSQNMSLKKKNENFSKKWERKENSSQLPQKHWASQCFQTNQIKSLKRKRLLEYSNTIETSFLVNNRRKKKTFLDCV